MLGLIMSVAAEPQLRLFGTAVSERPAATRVALLLPADRSRGSKRLVCGW